jgi:two-component system, response regulator
MSITCQATGCPAKTMTGLQNIMDNRTILLVEDNPDDVALTIRALRKSALDHTLVVANDGLEALELLQGNGPQQGHELNQLPRLVLLDLKLPNLTGLETLQRLRAHQRTQCLPVIILTSSREEQDILGSYRLGANSYLRKPVDFAEFVELIRLIGVYWLDRNEPPPQGGS